jgi:hypothetical protein
LPLTVTVPEILGLPAVTRLNVKVEMFNVEFVIASEKVAETEEFRATPIPLLGGDVADTVGGVVSGVGPVVNCQL